MQAHQARPGWIVSRPILQSISTARRRHSKVLVFWKQKSLPLSCLLHCSYSEQAVRADTKFQEAEVIVREALPEDAESMGEIQFECGGFWNAADLKDQMETPNRILVVAESQHDAQILGMVLMWCVADEVQIMEVAVSEAHQGKGVGTVMFAKALELGTRYIKQKAGRGSAVLEVAETNEAAMALYTRFGFKISGTRAGYYPDGTNAILMRLPIR